MINYAEIGYAGGDEADLCAGPEFDNKIVDRQAMQHGAFLDVCTIGVPSDEWGGEVKSVIQLNQEFTASVAPENELIEFARSRLPAFKCPRSVDFVDGLPRLPTGKIQRRIVREPYWEGREKSI